MNRHQVYQVLSWERGGGESDLSGTLINADKPVSVIPFSLGADLGGRKSTLAEQQYGKEESGKLFYTLPFEPHGSSSIKVVANLDSTVVRINGTDVATLSRGRTLARAIDGPTKIETSEPVVVMQFMARQSGSTPGAASMAMLPPVESYRPLLQWINPIIRERPLDSDNYWRHYAMITTTVEVAPSVLLDGAPVRFNRTHVDNEYVSTVLRLNPSSYHLTADGPVGCVVYGMAVDDAYAYMAGEGSPRVYSNATNESVTVLPFRITRDSARLSYPGVVAFGQVGSGVTTIDTTILLRNQGERSVTIETLFSGGSQLEVLGPQTITGDDVFLLSLDDGTPLTFEWGPCGGSPIVELEGSGLLPEIILSEERVDVGLQPIGAGPIDGCRRRVDRDRRSLSATVASALSSGLYICRIRQGGIATDRTVLIRD